MQNNASPWPVVYLAVAAFGSVGGYFVAARGPVGVPPLFVIVGSALGFLFTCFTAYDGLWSKYETSKGSATLQKNIWMLSPANPQANRFAQAIFFTSIGLSAILTARESAGCSIGFFPLSMGLAVATALMLFRWRYDVAHRTRRQKNA